jgi:hypothetical protein
MFHQFTYRQLPGADVASAEKQIIKAVKGTEGNTNVKAGEVQFPEIALV